MATTTTTSSSSLPNNIPEPDLPFVTTKFNFLSPELRDEKPFFIATPTDASQPATNVEEHWEEVRVYNARPLLEPTASADAKPTLDREGFTLVDHDTAIDDFYNEEALRERYYDEVIALVKAATGASDVLVFDHTLRGPQEAKRAPRTPVHRVHNDYTVKSGPQRVRDLTSDRELLERRLNHRFLFVNVWRPISAAPVEEQPLAVADARTIRQEDYVATDLIFPERRGEVYSVRHRPGQTYFYFPQMRRDEALLFKVYDSVDDGGQTARFVAHTAFHDPTSPAEPKPRESIEVRTIAFFTHDDNDEEPLAH